jgi:AAA15 family ATPase/GTPase
VRINHIRARNTAGLDLVEVSGLQDVVVIAGPNGVGKTRLIQALIEFFQNPTSNASVVLHLEATSDSERETWKSKTVNTTDNSDCTKLRQILQKNQKRNDYKSTVLNFDSDRSITNIQPYQFSWDIPDPYEENVGWQTSYYYLRDRFNDVQHSIFRLVESQRRKIAQQAINLKLQGVETMKLDFPDPLEKFKSAFSQLLAPKRMIDADLREQQIKYEIDGKVLSISNLSSGEKEVINVVFDFILRNPSDCIVLFDEPELHLHPELSYKLLQTLSSIGERNQFIFCTHSPEIITASIENSVIFLSPKKPDHSNQALMVSREDATHHALNLLGQSIGVISLGKKLLLIEGNEASLDKQTYGAILKNEFPELIMVPVGGKGTITSFQEVMDSVLNRTIWGVEFFLLCDRDALYDIGPKSVESHVSGRLSILPRYHLENYFLEESVIRAVFAEMEAGESWLLDEEAIGAELRRISLEAVPYAVALKVSAALREAVGNVDVMPKGIDATTTLDALVSAFHSRATAEAARIGTSLSLPNIGALASQEHAALTDSLANNTHTWKKDIPGRIVLNKFAGRAQMKVGRLKTMYLRHAGRQPIDPFEEVRAIFRAFRAAGTAVG